MTPILPILKRGFRKSKKSLLTFMSLEAYMKILSAMNFTQSFMAIVYVVYLSFLAMKYIA